MIKKIIGAVVLGFLFFIPDTTAQQTGSSATQNVALQLEPVIQISALSTPDINLGFRNINHYTAGIESPEQKFSVNSNKDYVISVRTSASTFSYKGKAYPTPTMPVDNILFLSVNDNNTGGMVAGNFSNYTSLSHSPKDLLLNCKNGADKTFSINYKADPGTQYPAGEYTVAVVYTATQP